MAIMRNDSGLFNIDSRWLGPKGMPLPAPARYVCIGLGAVIIWPVLAVLHKLGVQHYSRLAYFLVAVAVTVAITTLIGTRFNFERPLMAVLGDFWSETGTPRRPRRVRVERTVPDFRRMHARRYAISAEGVNGRIGAWKARRAA